MRIPFIAGNWKMNTTVSEATNLVAGLKPLLEPVSGVEKAVCPPFISLSAISELLKGSSIKLGAQNLFYEEKGAYTGEISPLMLQSMCEYVILGHSERRQYFGESNEIVNRKIKAALKAEIKPILCVGENLAQYEAKETDTIVAGQVQMSLKEVPSSQDIVVAYEPIWAIGTGKAATGEQANRVISLIRKTISHMYGDHYATDMRILYGGSVTNDNITEFIGQPDIDGALVGGASLKVDQFASIVSKTAQVKNR